VAASHTPYETYAEWAGRSRGAALIYSGRGLMYGLLLDVVGAFHSAASRRDKR
jgi:hypothetical protein